MNEKKIKAEVISLEDHRKHQQSIKYEIVHMHEKILSAFAHGLVETSDFDKDLLLKFFARQLDTALEKKRKISSH